jgi:GR25 family glycosyltransferase involved in LPS biosynthesis
MERADLACYVIGIHDSFRGADLEADLVRAGLDPNRVDAFDGRKLSAGALATYVDQAGCRVLQRRPLTGGEVGCALSHRRAYELLLESGRAWGLIFEDDAVLQPGFSEALEAVLEIDTAAPAILQLFAHPDFAILDATTRQSLAEHDVVKALAPPVYALGYAMNRAAAKLAIEREGKRSVTAVADWPPRWAYDVRFFAVFPWAVLPGLVESTLQRDRSGFEAALPRARVTTGSRQLFRASGLKFLLFHRHYPNWHSYWQHEVVRQVLYRRARRTNKRLSEGDLAPWVL